MNEQEPRNASAIPPCPVCGFPMKWWFAKWKCFNCGHWNGCCGVRRAIPAASGALLIGRRIEMRIGVVSDTHLRRASALPEPLLDGLRGVDLILHAGDWTSPDVVALFEAIAPVESVAGNNDGPELVRHFGRRKTIRAGGIRVGLIHGDGGTLTTEERAWMAFADSAPDVIVFGHSHIPHIGRRGGTLMFNPGSPTDKRFQPRYSFGLLEVGDGRIQARHIFFTKT